MKVLVISGFLGAGKTTFIKELAHRTHRDFAVMENEYGEVGIDGGILEDAPEKLNIWELTEGCVCCSRSKDFATSVLTIANTVDPEFLIVEPTGVGMLSNVLQNLSQIQYEKITLLSPITLLDGHSFDRYHGEFPEIYRDQITAAGTVLISKMESAPPEELDVLCQKIRSIHPQAQICREHYSRNPDSWWEDVLKQGLTGALPEADNRQADLQTLGLTDVSLSTPDQLLLLLSGVVSGLFGNIVRAKGCLKAGESWLRFDTADRLYSITGCEPMEESRAVFIGTDLKRSMLREILQKEITVTAFHSSPRIRRSQKNASLRF